MIRFGGVCGVVPHFVYRPSVTVSGDQLRVRRLGRVHLIDASRRFDQAALDALRPLTLFEFLGALARRTMGRSA